MTVRTCPACARRYAGVVHPNCPVCRGAGIVGLGPVADETGDPYATARAIDIHIAGCVDAHEARAAVSELRRAGFLEHFPIVARLVAKPDGPTEIPPPPGPGPHRQSTGAHGRRLLKRLHPHLDGIGLPASRTAPQTEKADIRPIEPARARRDAQDTPPSRLEAVARRRSRRR